MLFPRVAVNLLTAADLYSLLKNLVDDDDCFLDLSYLYAEK
ncbi:hypothetical protein HMPREF9012_0806 [Bacteroidetes bacterium oral taxon 272 str. F0290]|nr:hypothetical protein HMPREF9012_0806 [Bacteroidetes bacterium oral taxon 272 str. F0290]